MRTAECDILLLPDLGGPDSDLWLSRWARQLATARIVEQADWHAPDTAQWTKRLVEEIAGASRPVILVGHGLGANTIARAAETAPEALTRAVGAFLVNPRDAERDGSSPALASFAPLPRAPLPFVSLVVASRDAPHCDFVRAGDIAAAWGAAIVDAGESGHLDTQAGFGPWPEGLMRFAGFLKNIPTVQ
jgi:uncharacterized protein